MDDFYNSERFSEFIENVSDKLMVLKIYVPESYVGLRETYKNYVEDIQHKIINASSKFMDAGFDLYLPDDIVSKEDTYLHKVNFGIQCRADIYSFQYPNLIIAKKYPTGFYLYPRSSITKTPFRLANSTGIIDAGYRGNIIGVFDQHLCSHNKEYVLAEKNERLLQICAPQLIPIFPILVNSVDELGEETERGANGFGSTGK